MPRRRSIRRSPRERRRRRRRWWSRGAACSFPFVPFPSLSWGMAMTLRFKGFGNSFTMSNSGRRAGLGNGDRVGYRARDRNGVVNAEQAAAAWNCSPAVTPPLGCFVAALLAVTGEERYPFLLPRGAALRAASGEARSGWAPPLLLHLDFDEGELVAAGVDDVMLDAGVAVVGDARFEVGQGLAAAGVLQEELPVHHGHDDIVVAVCMPAGRAVRRKAPFRDADAVIVDLDGRRRLGAVLVRGHVQSPIGCASCMRRAVPPA